MTRLALSPSLLHHRVIAELQPASAFAGKTPADVRAWQRRFRPKLRRMLGLDLIAPRAAPLRPRTLWKRNHPLGTIEKVAFTSEPGSDVLAYVCLPRGVRPPYPFFVCLQGHSTGMHVSIARARANESRPFKVRGDRDFALGCMRRGVAALCIEQRAFGERREQLQKALSPHPCHDAAMHALMLGRTLVGERVFDVDRGIDYLEARGDADVSRLGVMGNSGGGVAAMLAAATLGRLSYAMPSCGFCDFRDCFMSIYHCADNYVPGLMLEGGAAEVMGLFAPRPVVVVAGRTDDIFPLAGVRRAFRELKRIYAAAGAGERCRLVIGEGGHRFYADAAWPVMLREMPGG